MKDYKHRDLDSEYQPPSLIRVHGPVLSGEETGIACAPRSLPVLALGSLQVWSTNLLWKVPRKKNEIVQY
jgi:hypothetical protein